MPFILRREALRPLLLQRTALQGPCSHLLRRLELGGYYERHLLTLMESFRRESVARLYSDLMQQEMDAIQPHLPARVTTVLDIGAGLGGINLLIARRYEVDNPRFVLLDKDEMSPNVQYFFDDVDRFYNLASVTRRFLADNGLPEERVRILEAGVDPFPSNLKIDLVVSLASWGHHYPIETYLDNVTQVLAPGGRVVVDLRKGTNGLTTMMNRFSDISLIEESFRHVRVAAGI